MAVSVFVATLAAHSPHMHELLHIGEQLCWHQEHTDEASQHPNHHGLPEDHQHGLVTLLCEHLLDEAESIPVLVEGHSLHAVVLHTPTEVFLVVQLYLPVAPRSPPPCL